jgi:hypothetical protein
VKSVEQYTLGERTRPDKMLLVSAFWQYAVDAALYATALSRAHAIVAGEPTSLTPEATL